MQTGESQSFTMLIDMTRLQLFKEALENMVDEKEQLLNATEMKIIFGHLPPIYSAHCNMLEELKQMLARWNEDCSIGDLILKYVSTARKSRALFEAPLVFSKFTFFLHFHFSLTTW